MVFRNRLFAPGLCPGIFIFSGGCTVSNKLFVGNVSFRASEDDLKDLFTKAGEVVSAKLVKDPATGRSKGFGFVEMATSDGADRAIQMFNGSPFMERNLVVDKAKPRQPQKGSRDFRHRSERRGRREA